MADAGDAAVRMVVVQFTVPGDPIAWQRVERNKRTGSTFVPGRVRRAERDIGRAYTAAGGWLFEGPVLISCAFYLGGRASQAHLDARDQDNLLKTVYDGLEGVAFPNDRRVVGGSQMKKMDPANPRTEVIVSHLAPAPVVQRIRVPRRAVRSGR